MIELPKYSVPTYNPNSLVDNERTDFTRRIPSLPEKQLARDSKIAMQLVRAQEQGADTMIDVFIHKAKLMSNPRYWEFMRTVWVAAGSTETAPIVRRLMKSTRPCKGWFMTPEDAAALDAMQFPLTVWRAYDTAYDAAEGGDPGISWTLDHEWCIGYAKTKGRSIKEREVYRDEIFAYVTRRGESEIILLD